MYAEKWTAQLHSIVGSTQGIYSCFKLRYVFGELQSRSTVWDIQIELRLCCGKVSHKLNGLTFQKGFSPRQQKAKFPHVFATEASRSSACSDLEKGFPVRPRQYLHRRGRSDGTSFSDVQGQSPWQEVRGCERIPQKILLFLQALDAVLALGNEMKYCIYLKLLYFIFQCWGCTQSLQKQQNRAAFTIKSTNLLI